MSLISQLNIQNRRVLVMWNRKRIKQQLVARNFDFFLEVLDKVNWKHAWFELNRIMIACGLSIVLNI